MPRLLYTEVRWHDDVVHDETAVITHHEAGHAVAALMTASADIGERVTVCLINGVRSTGNLADGPPTGKPRQAAFIYYAGPWAEARSAWGGPTLGSLGDVNEGKVFRDAVRHAFATSGGGPGSDSFEYRRHCHDAGIDDDGESFSTELETVWPVVQELADALRAGLVIAQSVPGPHAYLPNNRGRTMKRYAMPGPDVEALVEPLLAECDKWRYLRESRISGH